MTKLILLYHYFHPDDVVSARLFSDIAAEATNLGIDVTAMPSVRSCHDGETAYAKRETWEGGTIWRVWRPGFLQSSNKGRILNAVAVLLAWTWRALITPRRRNETMIVGTDPILGVLATIPWRLFRPRSKIVHWCHDVYPQAAVADGVLSQRSVIVRLLNVLLKFAYRRCDLIADLGNCMRKQLLSASGWGNQCNAVDLKGTPADQAVGGIRFITITPWSLVEPNKAEQPNPRVRNELFGNAQLGLLYSGNLGRAHEFHDFLRLARELRGSDAAFCYAGRGPRMEELKSSITPDDTNIRFAGFASEEDLALRLSAADIHMVSLRESWTGTVVPSKFFGAIAVGRPILFSGSTDCAIAKWIAEYDLGWVLTRDNISSIAKSLSEYASCDQRKQELTLHCQNTYALEFSKTVQLQRFLEDMGIQSNRQI